jgi:hypothetical protein
MSGLGEFVLLDVDGLATTSKFVRKFWDHLKITKIRKP